MGRLSEVANRFRPKGAPAYRSGQDVFVADHERVQKEPSNALGNHGIAAHFDINAMIGLLSQHDKEYVNISFQSGGELFAIQKTLDPVTNQKVKVRPPLVMIRGAFVPELAEQNLRYISQLPRAFPDRAFFFAAGNYGDNPAHVFQDHPEIVPENAFFVVECDREGKPANEVYGFPLGVVNEEFGAPDGSSQATVIEMEACRLFALRHGMRGNPRAVVNAVIETCTERCEYETPKIDPKTYLPIPGEFETHEIYVLRFAKAEKELAT